MRNFQNETNESRKKLKKLGEVIPVKLVKEEENLFKKLIKSNISDSRKIKKIWSVIDKINAHIGKHVICKAGCSHCCHINVTVTSVEAKIIANHIGSEVKTAKPLYSSNYHGKPCLFLINNKCSIYEVRPYFCRSHVSLMSSNYWCNPALESEVEKHSIGYRESKRLYEFIADKTETRDIRDWFQK
ncbi:TPA: YkgJ family cysteine cluster protein [Vibrio antiquarius]